jgi:DNA-binding NarL/FixJ family response regulator
MDDRIRVIIIDHEIMREGLRTVLDRSRHLRVVGEADSLDAGLRVAVRRRPDLAIIAVHLPDGSGEEASQRIRGLLPETKVLLITCCADAAAISAALSGAATGALMKREGSAALVEAIARVASGEVVLGPQLATEVMHRLHPSDMTFPRLRTLSEREREVLRLVGQGMTNEEIANELVISPKTAKNHVGRMLHKLQMHTRTQAAALAVRVFPPDPP